MYPNLLGSVKCAMEDINALWGEHPLTFAICATDACMHAICKEYISGNTRDGMEGVEGELVTSALGWGPVVLLGYGLTRSTLVIQNSQRPVPITSVSSRDGRSPAHLRGSQFENALEETWPCFVGVFWLPDWLPGRASPIFIVVNINCLFVSAASELRALSFESLSRASSDRFNARQHRYTYQDKGAQI
eukprot:1141135-Pelagomonas_calceolata.AAC.1